MNKTALLKPAICGLVVSCLGLAQLSAQSPGPGAENAENAGALQMIVDYGQGKTKKRHSREGMMEPVGLPLNRSAAITLKFAGNNAGELVNLSAPDGGVITGPSGGFSLPSNGSITFNFQISGTPGLYRLVVELSSESHVLSFYGFAPSPSP